MQKSNSGIYYIMLGGINRQQIFEDDEDRARFPEMLQIYKEQCGYAIYAYCLMGNHIHLLIKEGKEDLTHIFRRIAGSYVWANAGMDLKSLQYLMGHSDAGVTMNV